MSQHLTRSRECLRRVAAWAVVHGVLQLMTSAPAHACTCFPHSEVLWPEAGSSVSADTAIVITVRSSPAPLGQYDVVLRAQDGAELALKQVQHLPNTFACDGDIVFLRPEPELRPGMKYEVTLKRDEAPSEVVKFATREKTDRPKAATRPNVTYLSVAQHPDCERGQCYDLAEVRVELEHALHELTWLQIRSAAQKYQVNRWEFSPDAWSRIPSDDPEAKPKENPERVAQVSVPLPPEDPCVDIAIYGIDGRPVFEERRCEPDRCAVYKQRQQSTCAEPPSSGLEAARLSPTSCDDPPVLADRNGYPDFDAGAQDAAAAPNEEEPVRLRTRPAPDCQASPLSAASTPSWPAALLAAIGLLLWRSASRRST